LCITHLLFADDLLIFSKGDLSSLKKIDRILELLVENTGLSINREKRKIFFGKGCLKKEKLKNAVGMAEGRLPMKYLGIPLSINS